MCVDANAASAEERQTPVETSNFMRNDNESVLNLEGCKRYSGHMRIPDHLRRHHHH